MKKYIVEFFRRGMIACGIGPLVLGVVYLILQKQAALETLTVNQACTGIFSLAALAFIAGGMNIIYQMERLPLMGAILIHGGVLYVSYLAVYLVNGWLKQGIMPMLVFTGVFIAGYLVIWAVIYAITRRNTQKLNETLEKKRREKESMAR